VNGDLTAVESITGGWADRMARRTPLPPTTNAVIPTPMRI